MDKDIEVVAQITNILLIAVSHLITDYERLNERVNRLERQLKKLKKKSLQEKGRVGKDLGQVQDTTEQRE